VRRKNSTTKGDRREGGGNVYERTEQGEGFPYEMEGMLLLFRNEREAWMERARRR